MRTSQKDIVLNHLLKYKQISTIECYDKYKITDLQHAIYLLRKENYQIKDKWCKSENEFGWSNKYKTYWIER